MTRSEDLMAGQRHIALVGHDNMKTELIEWAVHNRELLALHRIYATGTTGRLLRERLNIPVHRNGYVPHEPVFQRTPATAEPS